MNIIQEKLNFNEYLKKLGENSDIDFISIENKPFTINGVIYKDKEYLLFKNGGKIYISLIGFNAKIDNLSTNLQIL